MEEAGVLAAVRSSLECIVCQEEFETGGTKVPKLLPCGHTLCAGCLDRLPKSRRSHTVKCPECKLKISLPERLALPNNVSVIRVLGAFDSSTQESGGFRCKLHKGASLRVFCATCNLMLCYECAFEHRSHDVQDPKSMDEHLYIKHETATFHMLDRSALELQDLRGLQTLMDSSITSLEEKSQAAQVWVLKEHQETIDRLTKQKDALLKQVQNIGGTMTRLLKRRRSAIADTIQAVEGTRDLAFAQLRRVNSGGGSDGAGPASPDARSSRLQVLCYESQLHADISSMRALKKRLKSSEEGTGMAMIPQLSSMGRLGELDADWRTPRVLYGREGSKVGELQRPSGVCLAPDGSFLIVDTMNDRLVLLSAAGEYRGELRDARRIKSPVAVWVSEQDGSIGVMNRRGIPISVIDVRDTLQCGSLSAGLLKTMQGGKVEEEEEGRGAAAEDGGAAAGAGGAGERGRGQEKLLCDVGKEDGIASILSQVMGGEEPGGSSTGSARGGGGRAAAAATRVGGIAPALVEWRVQLGLEPEIDKKWNPQCVAVDARDCRRVAVAYSSADAGWMVELSRASLSEERAEERPFVCFPAAECGVRGMAFDAAGRLLLCNRVKHCVMVLRGLEVEAQFGGEGASEGSFREPAAVAVDARGNIVVCDAGNHRVQVFSASFDLLTAFGSHGNLPGELDTPLGVAVDSRGRVAVADCGNHRVQLFDLPHASLRGVSADVTLGTTTTSKKALRRPRGASKAKGGRGSGRARLGVLDSAVHRSEVAGGEGNREDEGRPGTSSREKGG